MDMGYLAGIDLGTSSVKVLIMDPDGRTLAVSSRGYDVMTPKMSYAEQEPQVWWDCTVMAIREAMESVTLASMIEEFHRQTSEKTQLEL